MAYNKEEKKDNLLTLEKNQRGDYIKVDAVLPESKEGLKSVDIRLWYTADDKEIKPTQKGVRINEEQLFDVVKAMCSLLQEDEKENLAKHLTAEAVV